MRAYFFKILLTAAAYLLAHVCIIYFLPGPLPAAYWLRDMIIVKRHQATAIAAPKIVFLGGSSVLFGIDAAMVERALHMPAQNFGLHAGMRLDWLLAEGERAVKPGDVLVMALEPNFYQCGLNDWTQWQLYNSLAWAWIDYPPRTPLERLQAFVQGGSLGSPYDKIDAYWEYKMTPALVSARLSAMAPAADIVARYKSGRFRTAHFAYSAYNTDDHGDIQNNVGSRYQGVAADATVPDGICPYSKNLLRPFIAAMKVRGVRVVFDYFPYLMSGAPPADWPAAEKRFDTALEGIGGELIGVRDEFFFPRSLFFNTIHHLNAEGRKAATEAIIRDLQKLDLGKRPDAPR